MAIALEAIILSRFIEQHRWPFSYPADPKVEEENNTLKNQMNVLHGKLSQEKEGADKWRVAHALRTQGICKYQLIVGPQAASVTDFWDELLRAGGWTGSAPLRSPSSAMPIGVTMRVGRKDGYGAHCADFAQTLFNQYYSNPSTKVFADQLSPYLSACGDDCVQIEINY